MLEAASKIACLGGPKEAALYFDHVFPVDLCTPSVIARSEPVQSSRSFAELLAFHVPALDDPLFNPVMESLLGDRGEAFHQYLRQTVMSGALLTTSIAIAVRNQKEWDGFDQAAIEMAGKIGSRFAQSVRSAIDKGRVNKAHIRTLNREIKRSITRAGYSDDQYWEQPESFTLFGNSLLPSLEENAFFASLSGLKLVDVNKVSWQALIEFRKDLDAKAALRDLRLFFQTDLAGKSVAYAEDMLGSRVYHHERAVKRWGFDTLNRTLGVLFSKESALPAVGGLSAAFLGAPLAAAAVGAVGFVVGSCAVEIGRAMVDRRKMQSENPVRYLTNLKTSLPGL